MRLQGGNLCHRHCTFFKSICVRGNHPFVASGNSNSVWQKKVQPTLWVAPSFALLPRVGALHLPTLCYRKYNPDGVGAHRTV